MVVAVEVKEEGKQSLKQRLLTGARKLGNLWAERIRCPHGFDIRADGSCGCDEKNRFCHMKERWFALALEDMAESGREVSEGECGIAFSMTAQEWDATRRVMTVDLGAYGRPRIGAGGNMSMKHLGMLSADPKDSSCTLALMAKFPKSKIEQVFDIPKNSVEGEV